VEALIEDILIPGSLYSYQYKIITMESESFYRKLGLVEDRVDKCEVNSNFNHYCRKHQQPTCANHTPLHCAGEGALEKAAWTVRLNIVKPLKKSYSIKAGEKYCEECIGKSMSAMASFFAMGEKLDTMQMNKYSPAEIQAMKE
jgi:hypothetical protein